MGKLMFGLAGITAIVLSAANWPQAAGPNGTWAVADKDAPVAWSVARNEHVIWRSPMPNGGQSGIAVWNDKLFLTTFEPWKKGQKPFSGVILGHCLSAKTGKILWSVRLEGPTPSPMMYSYSDSTSPAPMTDGKTVWFVNNSGEIGAFDMAGKELWRHKWTPWGEPFPFNKQHKPILFDDWILNVEPLDGNPKEKSGWNYLRALNKNTGRTVWIADDGTTTYTTSVFGLTKQGTPAVLTGRGGWHDVPERPVGLSLIDLTAKNSGKTLWRYIANTDADGKLETVPGSVQAPTWQSLYTLHWDKQFAYWFRLNPDETHLVIDSSTGKIVREQSLITNVDYRQWDPAQKKYVEHLNVNLREMKDLSPRVNQAPGEVIRVMPAWHCNIVAAGYHYFLASTAHRRNGHAPKGKGGPSHSVGRVNVATGKVEYLELPVTVIRKPGMPDEKVYGIAVKTKTLDNEGNDVASEERSRNDGWEIPAFWGAPVALGNKVYFTTTLGITYVIDAATKVLDEKAILSINDLGPSGEVWSLNTPSYSNGVLYHRSLKEVVAIGKK